MTWKAPTEIWICPECRELYVIDRATNQPRSPGVWSSMCCVGEYAMALAEQAGREAEDE